jgi:polyisoprenoid-binding protein YceI
MKKFILAAIIATLAPSIALADIDVPAGDYTLDKSHASLIFRVSHMGFSNYTAQFKTFDAKLKFDPKNPENSSVEATIQPESLELPTPPKGFVEELLGKNWLNIKTHPEMTFKSTKVEVTGDKTARITGDMTFHGVTKPMVLDAVFNGGYKGIPDMDPNARIGFSASGVLKRSEYGVSYGIPAPGSNMGVSEVEVIIEAEFSGPELKTSKNAN